MGGVIDSVADEIDLDNNDGIDGGEVDSETVVVEPGGSKKSGTENRTGLDRF